MWVAPVTHISGIRLIFNDIPTTLPTTPLLDQVNEPQDLRQISPDQLTQLADELRAFLLFSVGQTGGHFSAGLGVVELTIALHYALNTPIDQLIWDVGHQSYPHKILTGRKDKMHSIRQHEGLAAFPKREESHYDSFGVGHSSTSISAALGMAIARDLNKETHHCVAVIGDGAITAGIAYEALNHAGHTKTHLLIILNDNSMSISENTGGLSTFLSKQAQQNINTEPALIPSATIFEDLGLNYHGPVDGHDIPTLIKKIQRALATSGPTLLHVKTQKGHGYAPALDDPIAYHALTKIEPKTKTIKTEEKKAAKKYQDVFGQWLCDTAATDNALVAITPAMKEGSGMSQFAKDFPERFFDVAIAEQHALTFSAGLACQGKKPVVAIYSTFLQRAYDQLIHDIALQNLNVTFAIDRAGLVGADGPTHAGVFDLSFLRCIPNLIIAAPSNENECQQLLNTAYAYEGPAAVRYPRGLGLGVSPIKENQHFEVGKANMICDGKRVCILNFGALLDRAMTVAEKYNYAVCDMRWVKPLDKTMVLQLAEKFDVLVTLEENMIAGGAGSSVLEYLQSQGKNKRIQQLGLPDKNFDQGPRDTLLAIAQLDADGIEKQIQDLLAK